MKRILVPTDFSLPARWASASAADIARRSEAEIIFLHVIEQPGTQSFNVQGQIDETDGWEEKLFMLKLIERKQQELSAWLSDFESPGVAIKGLLRVGNSYHGISSEIIEQRVDLVVMGTSGHSAFEKFFLGSNTDRVIRYSRCPVLTIHQKPRTTAFKHIVYATSLNEDEAAFAAIIKSAQVIYDATIHVVHVNTPSNFMPDKKMLASLQAFVGNIGLARYTINVFNDTTVEQGIVNFAESIKADLIGMTTHGRSGFAQVLVGSVAEGVVNDSDKPVLTYVTK